MQFFSVKEQKIDAQINERPCTPVETKGSRFWVVLDENHPYTFELDAPIVETDEFSLIYGEMKCDESHRTWGKYAGKIIIIIIVIHEDDTVDIYTHEVEVE